MAEKIKLKKAIKVNGTELSELTYDIDAITPENFLEADSRASSGLAAKGITNMNIAEFNSALHFYLGCFAIIACNPSIDITDLLRIEGRDINEVRRIGQSFFADTALGEDQEETPSPEKTFDESSEATADSTESSLSLFEE